ncbi:ATP-binding domain-containing protein, partial [Candidatus Woesearchaeota archaeon]|nr:ATP-binding domain-containing protein [Candidatus Woesearchaeota archaeon]
NNEFKRIKLIPWIEADDLQEKILLSLVEELKLKSKDDEIGFEKSLGGNEYKEHVYFRKGAENHVEDWQILSPVKAQGFGVKELNRFIQKNFKKSVIELANKNWRKIPTPQGPDKIVYGDKVINIENHRRTGKYKVYPLEGSLQYIANGEMGIVTGLLNSKNVNWKGKLPLKVCFSSQPGYEYTFSGSDFSEERGSKLELAYTITVHKSQGSDFNLLLLVLPNPCLLLSRELLYTSLTRQKDRIIVFYQGDIKEFQKYSIDKFSETSKRITNLFFKPNLIEVDNVFFEQNLIHRTINGIFMRSKSEVIIGNILESKKIEYTYERKLIGNDGAERYPDFTIEDEDSGNMYYWEHLGMLGMESYRKKWTDKLNWYKEQDILTVEEGGGKKGTLIITKDGSDGGLDSADIIKLLNKLNL